MPGGSVGRVERSQRTELAIAQRGFWAVDVDDITDEDRQLGWIKLVDLPRGTVARGDVDERRPDVLVGIVGPVVVFWDVRERTRCLVVDGDVDGGRGGATTIVSPNCVSHWTGLQDCWYAPNRTVTCTEVEAVW